MTGPWADGTPGLVVLPSGRRVRGRALRSPAAGTPPTFAVELTGRPAPEPAWERAWVAWPDFWLPADPAAALAALIRAHQLAGAGRVEIACGGGTGRTGTGLAALCVLEGMPPAAAVSWVRARYRRRAVEVRWQRRFLRYAARHAGPAGTTLAVSQ